LLGALCPREWFKIGWIELLRNVLQPAAEAAGLGRVTWHQFRHIHSSLLNDLNVPVKIAQEQLDSQRQVHLRVACHP
jgi:integrase